MASPLTIQPDAAAGKDAYIASTAATTNFGTAAFMGIGDSDPTVDLAERNFIAFDVSGVPAGATVTGVTLSLWEYGAATAGGGVASRAVELRRILRNWVEAQVTWNIYSTGNNWATAGCGHATDRVDTPSASVTLDGTAAAGFVDWSSAGLIADVQAWVDGTASNYGWLLSSPTAEYQGIAGVATNDFRSSDYATAGQRPQLVIEYHTRVFRSIGSGIGSGIASGIA